MITQGSHHRSSSQVIFYDQAGCGESAPPKRSLKDFPHLLDTKYYSQIELPELLRHWNLDAWLVKWEVALPIFCDKSWFRQNPKVSLHPFLELLLLLLLLLLLWPWLVPELCSPLSTIIICHI